jgi:plasmid stabilization system protein ParE
MSNPPLPVVYGPDARLDTVMRAAYLARHSGLHIADRFIAAIAHMLELVTQAPQAGRVFVSTTVQSPQLRYLHVPGAFHRTVVFYTITASEIRVERVLHSAQGPPRTYS